ncbi:plexin-A2-like [Neodiprion pinetum]|uniref:plexin-A2-like n=1 Tax=Neodiprion pinetum TaxID=441929 RepID=UPI001EE14113|nr:plexin-A2-like [Neodiprion pinetum]XP_046483188.1 plexin-A2-like [Neodiprion pinetum]
MLPRGTRALLALLVLSSSMRPSRSTPADIVHTFADPDVERLNHLVVDKNTGRVFVGGVNCLYQLSPDLDLVVKEVTGPKNDSNDCSMIDCPAGVVKKLTDNVNKALVIDYTTTRLISCGSLFQGMCTVRNLHNISDVAQEVREAVVANNATASTVAFIAPGPPNPSVSQVMYVGVTYTANSPYRSEVPAVSSRSLDKERMLVIAETAVTTGTRMFVNSLARERFPINYVHGFSSEGFSYFLTTQPESTATGSEFISKLVRVCHDDQNYYSYTEIPIDCTNELRKYNLVQAAYTGKAGSDLAGHLGITAQDDVLFAVFSESNATTNRPSSRSALCVYSLKAIRRKFMSNIQHCFAGHGQRGLDFISPSHQCVLTKLQTIAEDFCGLGVNTPLGGQDPIAALPVLAFKEHLTAVAATSTGDYTVVFVGTSDGHLKKVVVETATSAQKYGDLEVDPKSPVNSDLHFDSQLMHLYVMTQRKVSKVKVQECSVYKTCWDCLEAKDPYCGWCSLENKCNLRSDCQDAATDPLYWISYKSGRCTTIASVTPNQLQRTTARTLDLVIENLPTLPGQFLCAFSALDKTLITNATRKSYGVNCTTPRTDLLPSIPQAEHHFTARLSVRMTSGPDLVATNFTFFDCNTYSSCTQCVSSSFPCDWCVDGHRCTHDTAENCRNDILVTGVSRIGPSYRSGPGFCPTINATDSKEILISSGIKKNIRVKVHIIELFIVQTRFVCQFNIEGRVTSVNAQLLADTIYCDWTEFSYTSRAPNITVPFAVIWGGSKILDNPDNIHVVIYRCKDMADNCGMCLTLPQKYGCGWCQSSDKCEVKGQCNNQGSGIWLNRNETCPNPKIQFFEPQIGPWEGGTNVTIQGTNLGKTFADIYSGVSIAGLPCEPYPELYVRTKQIVCRVGGPGTPQERNGPVIVKIEDFRSISDVNFEFVDPVIESISPKYGPRSGGTVIRITGRYMNAGSKILAFIDNLPCSIINAEANETLCLTSASNTTRSGVLRMHFDSGFRQYNGVFEYVDDPTIESADSGVAGLVKIPKGIPAGGVKISVIGTNLGYVQNPEMYVYYHDKMFVSQCIAFNHTNMICNSPAVEVSADTHLDAEHPPMLEYGFLMDNVMGVQNLSAQGHKSFVLFPNPMYEVFEEEVKYDKCDYLIINGRDLNRACQESDVTVQVGNSFCNVTSLSRRQLTCQLPPPQPPVFDNTSLQNKLELPEVTVIVGGGLKYRIGKLSRV